MIISAVKSLLLFADADLACDHGHANDDRRDGLLQRGARGPGGFQGLPGSLLGFLDICC